MKKRYIVFGALALAFLLCALLLGCARRGITRENARDFAAETFRGESEMRFAQLAAYLTEDDHLTPDGMMGLRVSLESALTEAAVDPVSSYRLAASCEQTVSLARGTVTAEALATVYFGDWFGLHPQIPLHGGILRESAATTEFCVIDDLAAWRIFGATDVCGMDLTVNDRVYTVSAVLRADRGKYAEFYGEKPRIYILWSSAAMRDTRLTFTTLEALLPDPYTDAAKTMFSEAVASYTEETVSVTDRFSVPSLYKNIRDLTHLGVMEGKSYPYYENAARVMETKCAILLAFETACYALAVLFFGTLCVLIYLPVSRHLQKKRLAKKRHAIY